MIERLRIVLDDDEPGLPGNVVLEVSSRTADDPEATLARIIYCIKEDRFVVQRLREYWEVIA